MAKNTVAGGNPLEPIHGFDGGTPGEIIQSVVLVIPGTDLVCPMDPFFGMSVFTAPASTASYGTVTVGTSATLVRATRGSRRSINVQNRHVSNDLYVGFNGSVGTANGLWVPPGAMWSQDQFSGDVYAIASASGTDVRWQEIG